MYHIVSAWRRSLSTVHLFCSHVRLQTNFHINAYNKTYLVFYGTVKKKILLYINAKPITVQMIPVLYNNLLSYRWRLWFLWKQPHCICLCFSKSKTGPYFRKDHWMHVIQSLLQLDIQRIKFWDNYSIKPKMSVNSEDIFAFTTEWFVGKQLATSPVVQCVWHEMCKYETTSLAC